MRPSCPCDFEMDELVPFSPAWHEAHRDHHLERFPDVDAGTRRVLDELIGWAERRDALGAPPARISGGGFRHEPWCHEVHLGWACAAWRDRS